MSTMNIEHSPCPSCLHGSQYSTLQDTTNYSCDIPCLCRFDEGRSDKDKMYYDIFVLGKKVDLKPLNPPPNMREAYYIRKN